MTIINLYTLALHTMLIVIPITFILHFIHHTDKSSHGSVHYKKSICTVVMCNVRCAMEDRLTVFYTFLQIQNG